MASSDNNYDGDHSPANTHSSFGLGGLFGDTEAEDIDILLSSQVGSRRQQLQQERPQHAEAIAAFSPGCPSKHLTQEPHPLSTPKRPDTATGVQSTNYSHNPIVHLPLHSDTVGSRNEGVSLMPPRDQGVSVGPGASPFPRALASTAKPRGHGSNIAEPSNAVKRVRSQSTRSVSGGSLGGSNAGSKKARSVRTSTAVGSTTSEALLSKTVVSIAENRAREIGIAAITRNLNIDLRQFNNTPTYHEASSVLQVYNPDVLLMNSGAYDKALCQLIRREFPNCRIVSIERQYFNEEAGLGYIRQYAIGDTTCVQDKYLALCSAGTLFKYIEHESGMRFVSKTLPVRFLGTENTLHLDGNTLADLEVLFNSRTGRWQESLYGILKYTRTPMGHRFLRSTLVQPPCDPETVNTRLDALDELLMPENEDVFFQLRDGLKDIIDTDSLILRFVAVAKNKALAVRNLQGPLSDLIALKHAIGAVDSIVDTLERAEGKLKCDLIVAIKGNLRYPGLAALANAIGLVIDEDATRVKGAMNIRTQQCFAVKPGIDPLIDVARATYSQTIEDMYSLTSEYSAAWGMEGLKLGYTVTRGYHLTWNRPKNTEGEFVFPEDCLDVDVRGHKVTFTTQHIDSLSTRNNESYVEVLLLSSAVIEGVITTVREGIEGMYAMSEGLSLLDLILGYAAFVTSNSAFKYSRPKFGQHILVKGGRHPVVEQMPNTIAFVPNDITVDQHSRLQVLTGPNMSGKSTYIKTVGMIVLMAQIGCYVPCQQAELRLCDMLFTRLSTDDSLETNASSFLVEMRECASILPRITPSSIVLIDELGRGTSTHDGIGIAWAISEVLVQSQAFSFIATHFLQLSYLAKLYAHVRNMHLSCENTVVPARGPRTTTTTTTAAAAAPVSTEADPSITGTSITKVQPTYTYKVTPGSANDEHYGIDMARMTGVPADVIHTAVRCAHLLKANSVESVVIEHSVVEFQVVERVILACKSYLEQGDLDETALRQRLTLCRLEAHRASRNTR